MVGVLNPILTVPNPILAVPSPILIDGKVVNSWTVDGKTEGQVIAGIFSEYAKNNLNYVCLGGNQAWDWNDPDPAFCFDDVAIYGKALTQEQINNVIAEKTAGSEVYVQKKEEADGEYTIRVVAKVTLDGLADTYVGAGF